MMLMHGSEHGSIERKELKVLGRSLSRRKKVDASIGDHRPVAVLAGSVHAVERFFVEDDLQMMLFGNLLHNDHEHHVLINGLGSLAEKRRTLELIWRHLVVSCLKQDAELVCLGLEILHERADPRRDCSEIMVFKLLVFCGCVSDHCPACKHEVRTGVVQRLIYKEVLLLDSEVHLYRLYRLIEEVCHRSCCLTQDM